MEGSSSVKRGGKYHFHHFNDSRKKSNIHNESLLLLQRKVIDILFVLDLDRAPQCNQEPVVLPFNRPEEYFGPGMANVGAGVKVGKR